MYTYINEPGLKQASPVSLTYILFSLRKIISIATRPRWSSGYDTGLSQKRPGFWPFTQKARVSKFSKELTLMKIRYACYSAHLKVRLTKHHEISPLQHQGYASPIPPDLLSTRISTWTL